MSVDNRITMLVASKLWGLVLFGGAAGDILHDGFVDLSYVDVSDGSNVDTSETGKLKALAEGETTGDPVSTSGIGTLTMFNRSFTLDNGKTVMKLGVYSAVSGSVTLKIAKRNSSTSYTVAVSETFAHPGTGWHDFELSSPYVVPPSGDYFVGFYGASSHYPVLFNQPRAYASGNGSGTLTVTENASNNAPALRALYSDVDVMSVTSLPVEKTGAPESAEMVCFIEGNIGDVSLYVSRDGGATWEPTSMSLLFTQPGGFKVAKATADLSAHPSGSSVMWRCVIDGSAKLCGVALEAI